MNAYFSGVDDADEKETRIFGVFGELDKPNHKEAFRIVVGGRHYIPVQASVIFDLKEEEPITYPSEWLDNVSKITYQTQRQVVFPGQSKIPSRELNDHLSEDPMDEAYQNYIASQAAQNQEKMLKAARDSEGQSDEEAELIEYAENICYMTGFFSDEKMTELFFDSLEETGGLGSMTLALRDYNQGE